MGKKRKCIVSLVSGMTLAIGTATAGPPTPVVVGSPAPQQKITVTSPNTQIPTATPPSAIKIKEDAKPGQKLMDNNLGKTTSNQTKINEDVKPTTQQPVKVLDDATSGKAYDLTRR
ncbi:MAG: hypothetical protein HY911_12840 [Desulfobacterales bacterium]|nr:hypothetical protein [Desulfobacterales bacterium]